MKLLLIHQAFVPPDGAGGTRHYELAEFLLRSGDQVTIVAGDTSYLTGERQAGARKLVSSATYGDLIVLRAATLASLHHSFIRRVLAFLSFMVVSVYAGLRAGRVDLVMGTSPPIFQALSAWFVAALRRRPFLLEVRDLWPEFAVAMGVLTNPVLIWFSRQLEKFLYWRADHLLVNSPAYRDYLIDRGIAAERVSLVANGADPSMFDPTGRGQAFRSRWGLGGSFVVTYAGALGLANDLPVVLAAAELLREDPEISIVLAGDGKERQRLQQMAQEMGLDNVVFTGALPKSEMAEVLAGSDACLAILQDIKMFRTTYPNKVFDYMAAARPVVLAIDGVIREVVQGAGAGVFVPPGDEAALAAAIRKLASNPELAREMGQAGRQEVMAHFDRRLQAEEFAAVLHRVAGSA